MVIFGQDPVVAFDVARPALCCGFRSEKTMLNTVRRSKGGSSMRKLMLLCSIAGCTLASTHLALSAQVANPICPDNIARFDPGQGQDIVVPPGYTVSAFATGIN